MASSIAVLDENDVALTEIDYGVVSPGEVKAKELQYQNNSTVNIASAVNFNFPGMLSDTWENASVSPNLITNARIIRESSQGIKQTVSVVKESCPDLTLFTGRCKCLEYIGGVWTVRDTGAVNFPATAGDKTYILCDERILNLYYKPGTPGSYSNLGMKIHNGTSWVTPASLSDGTSKLSVEGRIKIPATDAEDWRKVLIEDSTNNMTYWGYAVEFSTTDASPTQAISTSDGFRWEYAYDLPNCMLYGDGEYHTKSDAVTPTFSDITANVTYEYGNIGRIVFEDDPLSGTPTYTLVAEYSYKTPSPGVYVIDVVSSSTVTVTIDGGSASAPIGVSTVAGNKNRNIIQGMEITLNTTITVGDQATVTISEMAKYLWLSLADNYNDYVNKDLTVGAIAVGSSVTVYTKFIPPLDFSESYNDYYTEWYVAG
jgi:hypothetical protein